jgi:hypothetical protein
MADLAALFLFVLLIATIAGWNSLMDRSSYRFDAVRRFAEPPDPSAQDRRR